MAQPEVFTFVVYHTQLSSKGLDVIANTYNELPGVKWKERWELFQTDFLPFADRYIEILFKSAKLCHPDCRCVVLTDPHTRFDLSSGIDIIRCNVNPDKPAYMRLLAQMEFLNQADTHSNIVFLDYDMLIQQPLTQLFNREFHVALTHGLDTNRIGGSFIMIRKNALNKGMRFLKLVERIFIENFIQYGAWGGVEAAMNTAFAEHLPAIRKQKLYTVEGITVCILPCEIYNYSLTVHDTIYGIEYLPQKVILHFRGQKKEDMLNYWKTYYVDR